MKKFSHIPQPIFYLGLITFFINISFVMVYSLSNLYLKVSLGIGLSMIGFLSYGAESLSYALKLFSGVLSDRLKQRKSLVVLGYVLVCLSRLLLLFPHSFSLLAGSRFLERIGNGIQATPLEAWAGDISSPHNRGAFYGFKRSFGMFGAFTGGVLAIALMHLTNDSFYWVFVASLIPVLIALWVLITRIDNPLFIEAQKQSFSFLSLRGLSTEYWLILLLAFVIMMARSSEAFFSIYMNHAYKLPLSQSPWIVIISNAFCALVAYPIGYLSDQRSRLPFLMLGIGFLILSNFLIAHAPTTSWCFLAIVLWGIQTGLTHNMLVTLVADWTPQILRGTGFGFFYLVTSLAMVLSGCLGGKMGAVNLSSIFYGNAMVGVLSMLFLLLFWRRLSKKD